ncbi:hypothetical protein K0U27_04670 [archaeon]|nr:hypothetical protein [archaeon]
MGLNVQRLRFFFTVLVLLLTIPATQASAEDVPKQKQQASNENTPDDTVCKEGFEQVWEHDGTAICVEPENVLKLAKSGWIHPETVDRISISDKRAHEVSENVHAFQFEYCSAVYNEGTLGVIVSSDTERIPVPIDPDIQIDQCQQYGTQIHASSDSSIDVSLFYEIDMQELFKGFEKKKANLEDDLINYHQRLLRLQDPNLDEGNLEEIDKVKTRIDLINHVVESYKQSLNTLSSLQ